jgi:hypothetical protein
MRTLLTQTFCLVCNTQKLYLNNNKVGDAGCTALAKAAVGGALLLARNLYMCSNPATQAAQQATKDALKNRK